MESSIDNIKILPETIRKNGYVYILLTRTPKKALYKQTLDNVQVGFEVFLICIRGAGYSSLLRKTFDACERFPSNEDFGKTAWSIMDYKDAFKKYQEL
jgi:hypothetical protein